MMSSSAFGCVVLVPAPAFVILYARPDEVFMASAGAAATSAGAGPLNWAAAITENRATNRQNARERIDHSFLCERNTAGRLTAAILIGCGLLEYNLYDFFASPLEAAAIKARASS